MIAKLLGAILFVAIAGFGVAYSLGTGELPRGEPFNARRKDEPFEFWFGVTVFSLGAVFGVIVIFAKILS
jgi:hypothetical protein